MLFRPALITMSALSLAGAVYLWLSSPPAIEQVFGVKENMVSLSGKAIRFTPARGAERVRVDLQGGGTTYTDCLAMPFVCEGPDRHTHEVAFEGLLLSHAFFWPLSVVSQGRAEVSPAQSRQAYALYYERETTRYRFPLAIAAALFALFIWIGKRPSDL